MLLLNLWRLYKKGATSAFKILYHNVKSKTPRFAFAIKADCITKLPTIILSQQILAKILPLYFIYHNFVNKFNVYPSMGTCV